MVEPRPITKDTRVSLPPQSEAEAKSAFERIIGLHGGSHIVRLINDIKPGVSSLEVYAGVRDEALVTCSRLLNLPEDWALAGQTDTETIKIKFNPKNGEPINTPEARLAFMENRISQELGTSSGSSLDLLEVISQRPRTNIISVGGNIGAIVHSHADSTEAPVKRSQSPNPETPRPVELTALSCEKCGSNDFHFEPKFFEQLVPPGGERPLFRQMVIDPDGQVAVIQGVDATAMFKPPTPIVLKCEHCDTTHVLNEIVSGQDFLSEFRRHYEALGFMVIIQVKKQ